MAVIALFHEDGRTDFIRRMGEFQLLKSLLLEFFVRAFQEVVSVNVREDLCGVVVQSRSAAGFQFLETLYSPRDGIGEFFVPD